jgi:hypothetical protein
MTKQRAVDVLVFGLGRAANAVYLADREVPGSPELPEAHRLLLHVTERIAEVARATELDFGLLAATWETIAVAQDIAVRARATTADSRLQAESARLMRREAQTQRDHAHAHAERIRGFWRRKRRNRAG